MMDALRDKIAAIGARFDVDVARDTRAAYRELLEGQGDDFVLRSDIAYGDGERQKLDLYLPAQPADRLRILLFVPGGGYVRGEKDGGDGFYANMGHYFATRGFAFAVMNYRLAPQDTWPAGNEDVGLAVEWLQGNAAGFGADENDVSVFGQSAGATHTLGWFFDPSQPHPEGISAIMLASGTYRVHPGNLAPNVVAYFGNDPATFEKRSPITHVRATKVPFLLMVAEYDPAFLASPTFDLAARLCDANGASPRVEWLAHHNHVSPVYSIGTPDADCGVLIEEFLASHRPVATAN